jgi:hypothetical protein
LSDFGGLPLVGGSIYGLRAWKQNTYGALVSPTKTNFAWRKGENVSACGKKGKVGTPTQIPVEEAKEIILKHYLPENSKITALFSEKEDRNHGPDRFLTRATFFVETDILGHPSLGFPDKNYYPRAVEWVDGGYIGSLSFYWSTLAQHMEKVELEHNFEDCSCGFYAYTKIDRNDYAGIRYLDKGRGAGMSYGYPHQPSGYSGIIEGYGTVTMGPYGFRAEKARIVAMYLPDMIKVTEFSAMFPNVFFYKSEKEMLDQHPVGVRDLGHEYKDLSS